MALGGLEEGLLEALCVGGAHAEFRELEAEEMQEMEDAGDNGDRSNFDGIAGDHGGDQAITS